MYIKCSILFIFYIKIISNKNIPELKEIENYITAHLNDTHIKKICANINQLCDVIKTNLCAVRKVNESFQYKDFNNSCFLFMENMCFYPGNEYHIAQSGNCNVLKETRRNWIVSNKTDPISNAEGNTDSPDNVGGENTDSPDNVADGNTDSPDNAADGNTDSPDNVADGNTDSPDNAADGNTDSPDNVADGNTDSPDNVADGDTDSPDNVADGNTDSPDNVADGNTDSPDNVADGNTDSPDNVADGNTDGPDNVEGEDTNSPDNVEDEKMKSSKPGLRKDHKTEETTKFQPMYEVDEAFDGHICPLSCPAIYEPVCVQANRPYGKYLKFWTFVNHCEGDVYYCKHSEEFVGPASDSSQNEDVRVSLLSWSLCAASKYFSFSRFVESASSIGHFGWLEGPEGATKIIEPHKPGYG